MVSEKFWFSDYYLFIGKARNMSKVRLAAWVSQHKQGWSPHVGVLVCALTSHTSLVYKHKLLSVISEIGGSIDGKHQFLAFVCSAVF